MKILLFFKPTNRQGLLMLFSLLSSLASVLTVSIFLSFEFSTVSSLVQENNSILKNNIRTNRKFFDRKFCRRVGAIFSEKSKRKAKLLLLEIDGFPCPKQVKKLSRFRKKRRRKINFPFYSRQSSKIVTLVLWFMI